MVLNSLSIPIIQAPMAGGVSTPDLASQVSRAGGLGFLAGGYKTASAMQKEIHAVRDLTDQPFGVNIFVPGDDRVDVETIDRYRESLEPEARRLGVSLGEPLSDDDDWNAKLAVLYKERVPVVSFTFGCPSSDIIAKLKHCGSLVVVTVTTIQEALAAKQAGADALCVQGAEAGGHRASFHNHLSDDQDLSLLVLLGLIREKADLPLIAAGGIMHGRDIAAVLTAGACAAQLGTAFLRCPESGAHPVHKAALHDPRFTSTAFTRAFTGRRARGLANRFMSEYEPMAPAAYPHLHHLTKELRKAAAQAGDPHSMSLWAGQGYPLAREIPAAELVHLLMDETRSALAESTRKLGLSI
ncbi:nitronate monooxygenase [Paenactinomyces guangxiensis]|uniref:Probable nitronate monooxygenase n=1 Tax=Paenactinomyces guangxiensis TaxID=1490290 RepID=A0A7W1WTC0_9BACL|nr:nitronate monooxygenase [Paenactinomyces guangxiensis]MBA4495675.1 nitronate monooxygenase [Paenactinomyces guangxiensis]MBH8592663.1 nitronate monooxygenase [Paenactinomyces guangxiensis]